MTARRRDNQTGDPFEQWTRIAPQLDSHKAGVSCTDIDKVWHQYCEINDNVRRSGRVNHVMFIEIKEHGRESDFSQRDTMRQLHQVFGRKLTRRMFRVINERNQETWLKFWGWHTLQFSGSLADPRGGWIKWNDRPINLETLIGILRFDLRPDNLKRNDRGRANHHGKRQLQIPFAFTN